MNYIVWSHLSNFKASHETKNDAIFNKNINPVIFKVEKSLRNLYKLLDATLRS